MAELLEELRPKVEAAELDKVLDVARVDVEGRASLVTALVLSR